MRDAGSLGKVQLSQVPDSSLQSALFHLFEYLFTRSSISKLLKQSKANGADSAAGRLALPLAPACNAVCWLLATSLLGLALH